MLTSGNDMLEEPRNRLFDILIIERGESINDLTKTTQDLFRRGNLSISINRIEGFFNSNIILVRL